MKTTYPAGAIAAVPTTSATSATSFSLAVAIARRMLASMEVQA